MAKMSRRKFGKFVGAAVAGLAGGAIIAGCQDGGPKLPAHACRSMNACNGQGGCAVPGKHDCAGKNKCKGQGGCATVKHSCKGQNACKGQGPGRADAHQRGWRHVPHESRPGLRAEWSVARQ